LICLKDGEPDRYYAGKSLHCDLLRRDSHAEQER
jgi:hypothetical protein